MCLIFGKEEIMSYFTVLLAAGSKNEIVDTFQATDFDDAITIINEKYPNQAFRLFSGKSVPTKDKTSGKVPPTTAKNSTWAKKEK